MGRLKLKETRVCVTTIKLQGKKSRPIPVSIFGRALPEHGTSIILAAGSHLSRQYPYSVFNLYIAEPLTDYQ